VLFDICTLENTSKSIKLQNISSVIENPLNIKNIYRKNIYRKIYIEKNFKLLGIIDFKMPPRLKCGSSQEIEHYTVICFCTGNFIDYNDLLTWEKN